MLGVAAKTFRYKISLPFFFISVGKTIRVVVNIRSTVVDGESCKL